MTAGKLHKGRCGFWSLCVMMLAGCLLTASCSEDEMTENTQAEMTDGRQPIRFSYATPTLTRGVNTTLQGDALANGLETGIYVRAAQPEDCYHNVKAVADGSGRLNLNTVLYYPEEETELVSAYTYAPYQEEWSGAEDSAEDWNRRTFAVQTDQREDEAVIASDLLWAEPAGDVTNPFRTRGMVQMGFRHLLTKVMVTLEIEKASVTRFGTIKVEMLDVNTQCEVDLLTGEVTGAAEPKTVAVANMELTAADFTVSEGKTITKTCCAIVVPQTVEPDAQLFRITMPDGQVRTATQPKDLHTQYESGKTFNYGLSLTDMTVLGDITEGEEIDLGLSVNWASRNVGATRPEEYGGLYGWADPTGVLITTNNDSYPSVNPPLEISGTEYDIARAQWGGTWRIPTLAHFDELLSARCTWAWGTYKGVWGCKVTGPNGNSIFLPAAGARVGYESQMVGTGGCYWSGTLDANSSTGTKAVRMMFMQGSKLVFSYDRYMGHSVRPVKDRD
ncbi:MAG: fimbrillin family protein [Clostridium sp.]|nr:fimbrillin family protein [Clostridium sp.]